MQINIVSNLREGKGLAQDAVLLSSELVRLRHSVSLIQWDADDGPPCDLAISLEVASRRHCDRARVNWIVPNPEWWRQPQRECAALYDRVLCKTRDAERLLVEHVDPRKLVYTGWLSEDRMVPDVPREPAALHVAGGSTARGTMALLACWYELRPPVELTLISWIHPRIDVPGVRWLPKIPAADLVREQNRCLWHLFPSQYEGWGHGIHEAMSCGALVLTPDAPPFDEFAVADRVAVRRKGRQGVARTCHVHPTDVYAGLCRLLGMDDDERAAASAAARTAYETECSDFRRRLGELLDDI